MQRQSLKSIGDLSRFGQVGQAIGMLLEPSDKSVSWPAKSFANFREHRLVDTVAQNAVIAECGDFAAEDAPQ
jgi:hypothetical protein